MKEVKLTLLNRHIETYKKMLKKKEEYHNWKGMLLIKRGSK